MDASPNLTNIEIGTKVAGTQWPLADDVIKGELVAIRPPLYTPCYAIKCHDTQEIKYAFQIIPLEYYERKEKEYANRD